MNKPFRKVDTCGGGGGSTSTATSDLLPRPLALSSSPEPIVRTAYGGIDTDSGMNNERKQDDRGAAAGSIRSIINNRSDDLLLVDVETKKELQVISTPSMSSTKRTFVSEAAKGDDDTVIKCGASVKGCMKKEIHPSNADHDDGEDRMTTKNIINRQTNNRKMVAMMAMMQNHHRVSSSLTSSSSSLLSPSSSTEQRHSSSDTAPTSNATFGTSHQSSGTTISSNVDIAVQTKHKDDEHVDVDGSVEVTGAWADASADGAVTGRNESNDLPQDEIVALAPLPPLSGTKRRHRPTRYRSLSDSLASRLSTTTTTTPPFSPSSSYGITNPHRRYHRRNSILRHLDGFGENGGTVGGSQDDMLMAAMIAAREVSDQSQYQHGSALNSKHRRTNSNDVVLTGTPPSVSNRFSFSRNNNTDYHHPVALRSPRVLQAEDMVARPPTSPTMTRRTMMMTMMPPSPPIAASTTLDDVTSDDHTTTTAIASKTGGEQNSSSNSRKDTSIKDESGGRHHQLEQPSVDSDGVAMEISDHLRNMGIIDGKDEGNNEEEHAEGEEEGDGGSNSRRRNFYSSWSDSDDTKWYMEMEENDKSSNAR